MRPEGPFCEIRLPIKASFRAGLGDPIRGRATASGCGCRRRRVGRADEVAFRPDAPRRRRCRHRNPRPLHIKRNPSNIQFF